MAYKKCMQQVWKHTGLLMIEAVGSHGSNPIQQEQMYISSALIPIVSTV